MGYYVIAVGGTGNKILESMVYGACADAFHTQNGAESTPLDMVRLLAVDVDASCGNTTRAQQACAHYEQVRALYAHAPGKQRGFHTRLDLRRWSMNLTKRAASVSRMVQNHKQDQILARTLFDRTEAELEYSEGFRGHPDLGVLFFADLLSSLDEKRALGQPDEMLDLLSLMRAEMEAGETVKVILCGSIFGGTGASGIPAVSQFLRKHFHAFTDLFELGAVLMLPYYKVPPASKNEELEIVVKSSAFLDKARTALQYYGMEGMIRNGENDSDGVYDALYLLGLPPEMFVTTRLYSTGSQSQENDAHLLEWLATRSIAAFFRTGFRGEGSRNIDCYYYQLHARNFSWDSFDREAELYRMGYGGLLKTSAVFFSECYPCLRAHLENERKARRKAVGYYAAWFHGVRRMDAAQRLRLEKALESLYHCLAFYSNWMIQVVRTLPPALRVRREDEEALQKAATLYQQGVARRVLLSARKAERHAHAPSASERDALAQLERRDAEEMKKQRETLQELGGSAWLELLKHAQTTQRAICLRQREEVAQQQERLEDFRRDDAPIDPQSLAQEEERLSSMLRVQEDQQARLALIGDDIRNAIREDILTAYPTPEREQGGVSGNDLFSGKLLSALHELLREYGLAADQRDPKAIERLKDLLQRDLRHLVMQRVPDRVELPRIIAGLSGSEPAANEPEGILAEFWAALLEASLEEVRA